MAKNLETAEREFWDQVRLYAPDEVKRFKPVLDDLIRWSAKQRAIQFTWHEGTPGSQRQFLVKYCLPEMGAAFWAAYPNSKDGAFLIVLADPHPRFPDDLRDEARRELAAIEGRPVKENEFPTVRFLNLIPPKNRQRLLGLMERWLLRVHPP